VVESTDGSAANLNAVLAGELEFGIVQADLEYQAYRGEGEWYIKGPQRALRSICGLHREMVTLVAADDSGIVSLADLAGRRVNLGARGSGQRKNAIEILSAVGIDWRAELQALEHNVSDAVELLHQGQLDAFFYTVGHPNQLVEEATEGPRPVHFVPIPVEAVRQKLPYVREGRVPAHLYPLATNPGQSVPTVGLMAVLVTSAAVDERYVYAVTMNLFENLDEFKEMHPAFALMSRGTMLEGFSAPLHPGAERYFEQAGDIEIIADAQAPAEAP
jgi:TRAP transporter TAXI family solute receptor